MKDNYLIDTLFAVIMLTIGLIFGHFLTNNNIESKKPLNPTVKIITINGIADTTYIYEKGKSK